jgi:hypothetical protein
MNKIRPELYALAIAASGVVSLASAQTAALNLPPPQFQFEELTVAWETEIFGDPQSGFGESRIMRAQFRLAKDAPNPSPGDYIYLQFEGGSTKAGSVPSLVIFVPGGSIEQQNKGLGISDTDPEKSGVQNYWVDTTGQIIEDVTEALQFFDLQLSPRGNGEYLMHVDLTKVSDLFEFDWVAPGGSIGTGIAVGSSRGFATPRKVEMVHEMN